MRSNKHKRSTVRPIGVDVTLDLRVACTPFVNLDPILMHICQFGSDFDAGIVRFSPVVLRVKIDVDCLFYVEKYIISYYYYYYYY